MLIYIINEESAWAATESNNLSIAHLHAMTLVSLTRLYIAQFEFWGSTMFLKDAVSVFHVKILEGDEWWWIKLCLAQLSCVVCYRIWATDNFCGKLRFLGYLLSASNNHSAVSNCSHMVPEYALFWLSLCELSTPLIW